VNQVYHFYEGESYQNQINYNSALSFCNGDSVVLDGGNYESYLWSNGSTQQNLTVTQSGLYWVDVTDSTGYLIPSDSLFIDVSNTPQISINAENISCAGLADGSIILDIVNQTNNYTIQWNQGLQGDSLINLLPGSYSYEYNDIYGCEVIDSINIFSPYSLNVTSQINPFTQFNFGSINSIINGGTAPYSIYLDGNLESNLIDSLIPGNYLYEVIDANGCTYSINIEIIDETITGIKNSNSFNILIQNPFTGNEIPIACSDKISSAVVYNTLGQIIPSLLENNVLYLSENCNGIIHLIICTEKGEKHFTLLKQ
jgi:hypothetical protein